MQSKVQSLKSKVFLFRDFRNWTLNFGLLLALVIFICGCAPPGPRALLKGKKYLDRGDYADAVAQLKIATDILATNAQAWNYYGVALQHAGQFTDAAGAYQKALELDRDLVEAHYNLGCLWMEENKFADAKTEFTAYTLRRSNTPEGWLKLGMAQLKANDLLLAEKSFSTAYAINTNSAEALNGLGLCRVARERYDDAAKFFAAAINAQPDFAPARLNLAIVDEQYLHDDKSALDNYIGYLSLPNPENRDAVNARIAALESPKTAAISRPPPPENETAISTPESAETKPPRAVETTRPETMRPQVMRTSSPPPAERVQPAQNVVRSEPPRIAEPASPLNWPASPEKNYAAGGVTPLPSHNETPKPAPHIVRPAPPVFPRYLYLSPKKPRSGDRRAAAAAFAQAQKAEQSSQFAEAMNFYRQAATLDPAWFEAQYNYGVLAYRLHDYDQALAADEMALAIQPDSADTRYNFALALKAANFPVDAANELKKILAQKPDDVRAHLALGNLYAQQLQDPAQARQQYLKVLAIDPRNPQAADIQFWLSANPP
jgi:lipoprotein NlpI